MVASIPSQIFSQVSTPPLLDATKFHLLFLILLILHLVKISIPTLYKHITSMPLQHNRLGHPNVTVLQNVLKSCNIKVVNKNNDNFCSPCCFGKFSRLPSHLFITTYNVPLELIYYDLWGPAPITSYMGYTYYICFVDAFSRFTWIYFLYTKSEALTIFKQFKLMVEL